MQRLEHLISLDILMGKNVIFFFNDILVTAHKCTGADLKCALFLLCCHLKSLLGDDCLQTKPK